MTVINDIVDLKNAIINNWVDIIETSDQIETMLSNGLEWLENEKNTPTITDITSNFEIPDIDFTDPLNKSALNDAVSYIKPQILPFINDLENLTDVPSPSELISIIEKNIPKTNDFSGLPEISMTSIINIVNKIAEGGISVSLNDLQKTKIYSNTSYTSNFPNQNIVDPSNDLLASLTYELVLYIEGYYNKNKESIDNITNTFNDLLSDDQIKSLKSVIEPFTTEQSNGSQQITSDFLFDLLNTQVINWNKDSASICNSIVSKIGTETNTIANLLSGLLNVTVDETSNLCSIYRTLTNSTKQPTIVQVISLIAAIPSTMIYKCIDGTNLKIDNSIFSAVSDEELKKMKIEGILSITNGALGIIAWLFETINDYQIENCIKEIYDEGSYSAFGNFQKTFYHGMFFSKVVSHVFSIAPIGYLTPSLSSDLSDTENKAQIAIYTLKWIDLLLDFYSTVQRFKKVYNIKGLMMDKQSENEPNTSPLLVVPKAITSATTSTPSASGVTTLPITITPTSSSTSTTTTTTTTTTSSSSATAAAGSTTEFNQKSRLKITEENYNNTISLINYIRLPITGALIITNIVSFVNQQKERKEGQAFDPRIRINFLLEPSASFFSVFPNLNFIRKFIEDKSKLLLVIAGAVTPVIDVILGSLYLKASENPYPGVPFMQKSNNNPIKPNEYVFTAAFRNPKGKLQEITSQVISWERKNLSQVWEPIVVSNNNPSGITYTSNTRNEVVRFSTNYNEPLFNDLLYGYLDLIINSCTYNTVTKILTISFNQLLTITSNITRSFTIKFYNNSDGSSTSTNFIAENILFNNDGYFTICTFKISSKNNDVFETNRNYVLSPSSILLKDMYGNDITQLVLPQIDNV
jgi:hypothetical protein